MIVSNITLKPAKGFRVFFCLLQEKDLYYLFECFFFTIFLVLPGKIKDRIGTLRYFG